MTQTIFITGASTGLGRATAKLFSENGWNVLATMRAPEKETELGGLANVTVLKLDVTKADEIDSAARAALAAGPVDVLFNNAGYGLAGPFEGASDVEIVREIETNVLGVLRVTKAFLPAFREQRRGVILTTTSIGGLVTFPFNSVYHATKWALEGWSESLAFELAPFGVKVRTVAPGGIATDFASRSLVLTQHPAYTQAVGRTFAAFTDPQRRALASTADEIAQAVWRVAHDESDRVSFVAGRDAEATFAQRLAVGIDAFRAGVRKVFLGG